MTERGQTRVSFPAWRVYCHGMDVTDDVHSCVLNWADARSPNTAQFTLSSELDRYTITEKDILAMYDDVSVDDLHKGQLDTLAAIGAGPISPEQLDYVLQSQSTEHKIAERINGAILDDIKRKIILSKLFERAANQTQKGISDGMDEAIASLQNQTINSISSDRTVTLKGLNSLRGDFLRFPFQVGSCIFHTGDQVSIFWRDPYKPTDWYFGLRGFISDTDDTAEVNGLRSVNITVQGPLRLFNQSRITTNPSFFDLSATSDKEHDTIIRSWHTETYTGLTFPEIVYDITFGRGSFALDQAVEAKTITPTEAARLKSIKVQGIRGDFNKYYSCNGPPEDRTKRREGIGVFNFEDSKIHILGTEDKLSESTAIRDKVITKITLEDWQSLIDHKIPQRPEDIVLMCIPAKQEQEHGDLVVLADVITGLVPVEDVIQRIGEHPELYPVDFGRVLMLLPASLGPGTNRQIMLKDLIQGVPLVTEFTTRLQQLYAMCERLNFSIYDSPRGDIIIEMPLYSYEPESFGKYAERYIYPEIDTVSQTSHFSDDKVKTLMICDPYLISGLTSTGKRTDVAQRPGSIEISSLVPIFGIRAEKAEAQAYIASREAATYYAKIKLSQINADAWMPTVKTALHIGVGPNRPCYFQFRDFISTTRSITNAITWGEGSSGHVDGALKLNYRRGWSGQMTVDRTRKVYESFGGFASEPIDYNRLFDPGKIKENTKTLGGDRAEKPSDEVEKNRQRTLVMVAIVAQNLSVSLGLSPGAITANDLAGSTVRSKERNAQVGGAEHSHHLDGTAVDIPLNAKTTPLARTLAGHGVFISPQDLQNRVAQQFRDAMSAGQIDNGLVLPEPDGHIHYGRGEGGPQPYWFRGQRS